MNVQVSESTNKRMGLHVIIALSGRHVLPVSRPWILELGSKPT